MFSSPFVFLVLLILLCTLSMPDANMWGRMIFAFRKLSWTCKMLAGLAYLGASEGGQPPSRARCLCVLSISPPP
jgi:apolipoprotein N-acyltransferase